MHTSSSADRSGQLDILAIAAHPDDIELSCAGTLMLHASQGMRAGILDLTAGELGSRGTPEARAAEAKEALHIMGLTIRDNAGLPDGFFKNDQEHQLRVIQFIRKYRPEIVLANAVEDRHPDHGRAAQLIRDACFLSGLIKIETTMDGEKQEAWRPKQVLHFIQDRYIDPDVIIDISEVMDKKIAAIRAFKTQFLAAPDEKVQTYISTSDFFDSVIYRAKMFGKMIGVQYGEGFTSDKKIGLRSLKDMIW